MQGEGTARAHLAVLENHFSFSIYLVGNRISLADIMVAVYISRGMEWVLDEEWAKGHPGTMEHWRRVGQCSAVEKALGPDWWKTGKTQEGGEGRTQGLTQKGFL